MNLLHTENGASSGSGYPVGRGHAWFAFAMTMALMMVDYLDRQVIVSLFPHIKAEWGLSDTQLGALVSIVSVTVALAALPVALLADRWSRVRSIVVMATVWSLATISCLFTRNYGQLMAARALVGLGEAGYGSVGAALIAGLFPARLRAGLLAAFFASASVGSVLGVMLGGLIAARWGWQAAFGVVGLPGLLLALMYMKVRDYRTVALVPTRAELGRCGSARRAVAAPVAHDVVGVPGCRLAIDRGARRSGRGCRAFSIVFMAWRRTSPACVPRSWCSSAPQAAWCGEWSSIALARDAHGSDST